MTGQLPADIEAGTGGKYRVERLIGEGGMGAVYLGIHPELGSKVAIKILPPETRADPARVARFRREAEIASNLSHRNLVPVFELDVTADLAYLVMPYIEGATLAEILAERGKLTEVEVRGLIHEVGEALSYAHARGVIHRDIKPSNLILHAETNRWLITDFGVAHMSDPPGQDHLTATDATIGTVAYMAPEQLGGARNVDGRADLYALASVAYETLTGEMHTREGADAARVSMEQARPDVPGPLIHAIAAGLAEARDQRPASVQEWLEAIEGHPPTAWRTRLTLGAAAILAVLAVGALIRGPPVADTPTVAVLPFGGADPLDSILPQLLTWEIQKLPQYRVIEDSRVRAVLNQRFGQRLPPMDSVVAYLATVLDVDEVLVGSVATRGDSVSLDVEIIDAARGARVDGGTARGVTDDMSVLLGSVVVDAFADRLAEAWTGSSRPVLPSSFPAVVEYFEGDRAFRRGDLDAARQHFDRVIALDSAYAPAYLKRVLATAFRARPSEATLDAREAVARAAQYRDGLDPVSQQLLEAYEAVTVDGNIPGAIAIARGIVTDHPDAIDAWFLIGTLEALLPSLAGTSPAAARAALAEVIGRDPMFAHAYAMQIQVGLTSGQIDLARDAIGNFLSIDSTSQNAHLVALIDTLLFQPGRVPDILSRLHQQPPEILENLALGAVDLTPPPGGRAIGVAAIDALRQTATTPDQRRLAFRMRMAAHLGSGDTGAATTLLRNGRALSVPGPEVDRWAVLGHVTAAPSLVPAADAAAAAERLRAADDEPLVNAWLVQRWDLFARSPAPIQLPDAPDTLLRNSLEQDLRGVRALLQGDTTAARATWSAATSAYSIERMLTGFAASLWATRADLGLLDPNASDAVGRQALATFDGRLGAMDQVVWSRVIPARAESALMQGDTTTARRIMEQLERHLAPDASARATVDQFLTRLGGA